MPAYMCTRAHEYAHAFLNRAYGTYGTLCAF